MITEIASSAAELQLSWNVMICDLSDVILMEDIYVTRRIQKMQILRIIDVS